MMKSILLCGLVAIGVAAAFPACVSPEETSGDGSCTASSCGGYCRALGRTGGHCSGGSCVCDGGGDGGDAHDTWDVSGPTVLMTGTVWSPGHLVPISGALVYFGVSEPAAIPSGAYAQACEDPPSPYVTFSAPDGTFSIHVRPGSYWLTVQKGQFRRVRTYAVPDTPDETVSIDEELTTLPNRTDESVGDTIPHIALSWALSGGDHIEDVLAKMTLGQADGSGTLRRGTEPFDIYNISGYPPVSELITNLDTMLQYHIIFFPCTIGGGETLEDPTDFLSGSAVLENIRRYVTAGGKLYATDMMYDIFEQPMPEYLDMCGDDTVINDADSTAWEDSRTMSGWRSHGQAIAPDLAAWLDASLGIDPTNINLDGNFVWIEGMIDPLDPAPTDPAAPKTWVQGDFVLDASRTLPLTVTWPYGSGKVLFSTYHTDGENPHTDIFPQEYILLYLIMEIGVCQDPIT